MKSLWQKIPLNIRLIVLAIMMFIFSLFIMPPLYTLFCEVTGINGKTNRSEQTAQGAIDVDRQITVQFITINTHGVPWDFKPEKTEISVHPGEIVTTYFEAKNLHHKKITIQAIPSVAPSSGSLYFNKTECFCFNQQTLVAGETEKLGLQFIIDRDIPKYIKKMTLSYSLFDITETTEKTTMVKDL